MTAICGVTTQMASDWFSFFNSPHLWREQKQSQLTALQWRLKTTDIRSSIGGGLFLEQISMQKNAINLNANLVNLHLLTICINIHCCTTIKKILNTGSWRTESGWFFSCASRKTSRRKCSYLAKLHKACLFRCPIKFCGYKFTRTTKFSLPKQLSLCSFKFSFELMTLQKETDEARLNLFLT